MNFQQYEQSVFISYAWGGESEELVNRIDQALQQRGLRIIRDKRDLGYKGSISAFMERIGQGNCIIVVISDKYLRSPNCMFELVEIAEGKQFHDRIFPIVLSNAEIYDPVRRLEYIKHWEGKLAELDKAMREVGQANLQGIREEIDQYSRIRDKVSGLTSLLKDMNTLTPDLHRDSDFGEIYTGIERRMGEAAGLLKPETGESPYMGLRYFDTSDAALFYGREALTDELLGRVQKESFLAIVGASGSGKSSVARAGLIPAWKAATLGTVYVITPTARPLESLAASLTRKSESVTATVTLLDDLQKDPRTLRLYVRKILSTSQTANLLLVVDQFEETFTLCKDTAERKAFIENLLSLADDDGERAAARVVITLRADFYHHCAEYESLRLAFEKHQTYIGAMAQDELREAIVQPAENNGWDFQPGMVDLILQDVGTEPGALPLLSHALLETWKRRQGRALTLQGYHEAGGVKKAIAQTAESVYDKLSPAEQTIARNIFLRLTELGEGVQDTRRRVKMDELVQAKEQEAVARVIKTLTDARLVTAEQDSAEVAHEALIREWGTLRKWLDEDRESLRLHRHLTESAHEWQRRGREASELYRGTRLVQIQEWVEQHSDGLSPLETGFVKASQNVKTQERLRQAALTSVGVMLLLMAVLGATGQLNRFIYYPLDMEHYWVTIPAGEFQMGSENGESNETPVHNVYLDEYQIGKYEITNNQYNQCIRAGVCTGGLVPTQLDHPVVHVNRHSAETYCEWVGGRLPTEAEWAKAASWDDETKTKRTYPWGERIDCSHANYHGKDGGGDYCVGGTTPVGSYESGKSPYGIYDMGGNVWEWVSDWYAETYYQSSPSSNPMGPDDGQYKVLRGGSWNDLDLVVRSAFRSLAEPSYTDSRVGFRCSRSP
jgi:formylglycine-generating enzyme required for sulfatase activity/ABC-type dipeptide/oligopeptide/nickel transport system ATPase component